QSMAMALSSASALGDWRLLFLQRDRTEAATADDVNRVARTYFARVNRTVGTYIPVTQAAPLAIPPPPALDPPVKDHNGGTGAAAWRGLGKRSTPPRRTSTPGPRSWTWAASRPACCKRRTGAKPCRWC